jgi:hypothetical protein
MVGTKKGKGGKEVPNCVPEETEVKSEAYNKDSVDKAIKTSRQKIGGREAKLIHALLKGRGDDVKKNVEIKEAGMPSSVIKHKQKLAGMTNSELADRFKDKSDDELKRMAWRHGYGNMSSHYVNRVKKAHEEKQFDEAKEPKMVYKKMLGQHTVYKGNELHRSFPTEIEAMNHIRKSNAEDTKKTFPNVKHLTKDGHPDWKKHGMGEEVNEAKAESPIKGTRKISVHQGKDGHHAEVRHNPDWNEFQVHHYENGKHMGEGPVSYHDTKADAQETAEYEVKNFRPKGRSLRMEEVQIDELSKKTLGSYVVKSLVPNSEKSISNLASKGGFEQGERGETDSSAGEKEDKKSVRRSLSVLTAVRKLTKEESKLDEKLVGKQHKLDKNKNGKLDKQDFKLLRKEKPIDEKLNPSMGSAKYIDDFVKSKDPRFEGKTKKERIKMALGAYYGAKNESVETEEVDTIEEAKYGEKRNYSKHYISVDGKYVASTTWARNAKEAEKKFIEQHPEHKNSRITIAKER